MKTAAASRRSLNVLEVRGAGEMPLLHFVGLNNSVSRAGSSPITDHSRAGWRSRWNALAGQTGSSGIHPQGMLSAARANCPAQNFRDRLARLLTEQFPDETLESLMVLRIWSILLSGNYSRGLLRRGSAWIALLAVPDGESADTADNSLTFALLGWRERASQIGENHWSAARDSSQGRQAAPLRAVSPT